MCACTYGCPTMIWGSQFTGSKFLWPRHSKAKWYWNIRAWDRERFIARPCEENKWFMTKKPQSPRKISGSIFKGKFREGYPRVCVHLLHDSFIDWWWLRWQKVWGLWYSWSSNSEFLPLEIVFSTWNTQELCMRLLLCIYFREELWQSMWGKGLSRNTP